MDGVSLTVNGVDGAVFDLNVVPHTLDQTVIVRYRAGTRVNLEVDLIGHATWSDCFWATRPLSQWLAG